MGALERAFRLLRPGGLFIAHIGMYFSRRGSHMYRRIRYPYPTLFFNEHELEEITGEGIPFVNTMTCSHYRDFCARLGFRTLLWQELTEPSEVDLLKRYPKTFQKFPTQDLDDPLLNVALWKPRPIELDSYRGVPRILRGPASDWRSGLGRVQPYHVAARYAAAAHFLSSGSSALDLACGCGTGARFLAQYAGRVLGIDPGRAAIDAARRVQHPQVSYICGRHLPELAGLEESFDTMVVDDSVFAGTSFTHQQETAACIAQRLRLRGVVIVENGGGADLSSHLRRRAFHTLYDGSALVRIGAPAPLGGRLQILEKRYGG